MPRPTFHSPLFGWLTWIGLSLLATALILTGNSYPSRVFQSSLLSVFAQPIKVLSWIPQQFNLASENRRLRQRATELFVENCRLRGLALEGLRLEELLGIEQREDLIYFPARVIARSSSFGPRSLVLDRGLRDGLRGGEALITPWGLAGVLVEPGLDHSRAILLSHRDFRARAMVQRTREEGLLQGGVRELRLLDIPLSSDLQVGDPIITSGGRSSFPGGLPIGVVSRVEEGGGLFKDVWVEPIVRLNRLEELFVTQAVPADSVDVRGLMELPE